MDDDEITGALTQLLQSTSAADLEAAFMDVPALANVEIGARLTADIRTT